MNVLDMGRDKPNAEYRLIECIWAHVRLRHVIDRWHRWLKDKKRWPRTVPDLPWVNWKASDIPSSYTMRVICDRKRRANVQLNRIEMAARDWKSIIEPGCRCGLICNHDWRWYRSKYEWKKSVGIYA